MDVQTMQRSQTLPNYRITPDGFYLVFGDTQGLDAAWSALETTRLFPGARLACFGGYENAIELPGLFMQPKHVSLSYTIYKSAATKTVGFTVHDCNTHQQIAAHPNATVNDIDQLIASLVQVRDALNNA